MSSLRLDRKECALKYSLSHHHIFSSTSIHQHPLAVFYDRTHLLETASCVAKAFSKHAADGVKILHCAALKACPLDCVLQILAKETEENLNKNMRSRHGAECASIGEVLQALKYFPSNEIVFDSPCKTLSEIVFSLSHGIHHNIDSLQELKRVEVVLQHWSNRPSLEVLVNTTSSFSELFRSYEQFIETKIRENNTVLSLQTNPSSPSTIGLRINPLVGGGSLSLFSVATLTSKFGIPITSLSAEDIVARPWITCLMIHTGSHGCGLHLLVEGVKNVVAFAVQVNDLALARNGKKQITCIDIGGGVPAVMSSENDFCDFEDYTNRLSHDIPLLFSGYFTQIITEFGASMFARCGWVASRIEYTKPYSSPAFPSATMCIIHAGADLFLRLCYAQVGCHPITLHNTNGDVVGSPIDESSLESKQSKPHFIFGPLCFSGDELTFASSQQMTGDHEPAPVSFQRSAMSGDYVILHNAGANVFALFSHHCSRNAPQVILVRDGENGEVIGDVVRHEDRVDQTITFWNGW
jgi:diaminopimelate decarboxylase